MSTATGRSKFIGGRSGRIGLLGSASTVSGLAHEIDHINRDPGDNRIENLRDVTAAENVLNRRGRRKVFEEDDRRPIKLVLARYEARRKKEIAMVVSRLCAITKM
jgi:hypothetical protein